MKLVLNKCFFLLGLLAITMTVFTGCSHKVLVAPNPPAKIGEDKIPLDVGLYISDEFKSYQVSESRWGDTWNYPNLGQASASQFQLSLDQRFRSVELVDGKPPFPKGKEIMIQAVVEPVINKFDFDIPFLKFQLYPATIKYKITVYDIEGNIILTQTIDGVGDTKGKAGFDFTENPSKAASKAVEDGVKKAVEAIVNSDPIMRLQKK